MHGKDALAAEYALGLLGQEVAPGVQEEGEGRGEGSVSGAWRARRRSTMTKGSGAEQGRRILKTHAQAPRGAPPNLSGIGAQ